jgi:hypothetical protein
LQHKLENAIIDIWPCNLGPKILDNFSVEHLHPPSQLFSNGSCKTIKLAFKYCPGFTKEHLLHI